MLFNSPDFFVFLLFFFTFWLILRRNNQLRHIYLAVASLIFYGWSDWRLVFLILISGTVSFLAGRGMVRLPWFKKLFLFAAVLVNIGMLALFKYANFFIEILNRILGTLGIGWQAESVMVSLPIGISFYTFESISYVVDVYKERLQPARNIVFFLCYLSMFPQLLAGPIVRARDMLPQLQNLKPTTEQQRWDGLWLIVYGFFSKVVIADNLAVPVNNAFANPMPIGSAVYWWVIMAMYAFQIYFDFNGYSSIARGLAKLMGYEIPLNFNHPYISSSFHEFWTRWHISLSTWFRDYVYIPLGGSRTGKIKSFLNLWVTMLLSGLWHGAAWTFIVWAALHSFYISLERITNWPQRLGYIKGGRYLASLMVFLLTCVAWVFFRAPSFTQAARIFAVMFSPTGANFNLLEGPNGIAPLLFFLLILLAELYYLFSLDITRVVPRKFLTVAQPAIASIAIAACIFFRGPGDAFIYFKF
jgi:D-alanyl-lipoteichoic acid acyltransferase DltB (MBOAT superfamily)